MIAAYGVANSPLQARIRRRLAQRRYEAMVAATTVLTSALRMYVVYREWRKRYRSRTKERDAKSPSKEERSCVPHPLSTPPLYAATCVS